MRDLNWFGLWGDELCALFVTTSVDSNLRLMECFFVHPGVNCMVHPIKLHC